MGRSLSRLALLVAGTGLFAAPTDLELAYASRIAYSATFEDIVAWDRDPGKFLAGYRLMDWQEDSPSAGSGVPRVGFRAIALRNDATRSVIIAYRGTEPRQLENVAVDAGLFLAVAGNRPQSLLADRMEALGAFYGGKEGLGVMAAGMVLARMKPETGEGAWWLQGAISLGFSYMGMPLLRGEDLKAMTRTSCDHAIQFFKKTRDGLIKEAGDVEGGRIYKAAVRWGIVSVPRVLTPNGYTIHVTGHSLGGFLAQVVAGTQGSHGVTFAAPGATEYLGAASFRLKPLEPFVVRNVFRRNDVVGAFGTHVGRPEPLMDFFDSPVEEARLQDAVEAEERRLVEPRARLLDREREAHPIRLASHRAQEAAYVQLKATYDRELAEFQEARKKMGYLDWTISLVRGGPTAPVAPGAPPAEPTEATVARMLPNRYLEGGSTTMDWAKVHYGGMAGFLHANHSLEGLIHQFEQAAGIPFTRPYSTGSAIAPEVVIEGASLEVEATGTLELRARRATGEGAAWVWTASAGTITDLGEGLARFTPPAGAAPGETFRVSAGLGGAAAGPGASATVVIRIRP